MLKILGFVVGASFAVLLLTSQTERFSWENLSDTLNQWVDEALSFRTATSGVRVSGETPVRLKTLEESAFVPEKAADEQVPEDSKENRRDDGTAKGSVTQSEQGTQTGTSPVGTVAPPVQWQAIWNPFRSERSAGGFASRLERLTQREYRVERLGPGVYQVMFAFSDEADRTRGLSMLEQHTGIPFEAPQP